MSDMNVSLIFKAVNRMSAPLRGMAADVNKGTAAFDRHTKSLERNAKATKQLEGAHEKLQKRMQMAANLSLVASNAERIASKTRGMISKNIDALRPVARAQGELATLGVQNLKLISDEGRKLQRDLAYVTAESFISASYDIKSGISTLSDDGVAAMTSMAVYTAKATKASEEQMTSLFATAYGTFKQLDQNMSDKAWGAKFSAGMSASVNQFKTDGAAMQQAIESAGSGASLLGMQLEDQLTTLGMLQQKMKSADAGTAFKSFTENAGRAQAYFEKMGMEINLLDDQGKMRGMAEILSDIQGVMGEDYNASIGMELQQAFGTAEAVKVVQGLWNQSDAFSANATAIKRAQTEGMNYTKAMAKLADQNPDAVIQLFSQRMDLLRQQMGEKFMPILEPLLGYLSGMIDRFSAWMDKHPKMAGALAGLVFGFAGLTSVLSGVFSIASGVIGTMAMTSFSLKYLRVHTALSSGGFKALGMSVLSTGKKMILFTAGAIKKMTLGLWGMAVKALPAVITGMRTMGVAVMSNPIGLIIGGIALGAALIIRYWKPIKQFFVGIWDGLKPGLLQVWEIFKKVFSFTPLGMLTKAWGPAVKFITSAWEKMKAVGKWFSGEKKTSSAPTGMRTPSRQGLRPALASVGAAAAIAASPPLTAAAQSAAGDQFSINAPISIVQQPGQSGEEVAQAVSRELNSRERRASSQRNGRLYD